jgi:hypothetical protein
MRSAANEIIFCSLLSTACCKAKPKRHGVNSGAARQMSLLECFTPNYPPNGTLPPPHIQISLVLVPCLPPLLSMLCRLCPWRAALFSAGS